MNVELLMLAKAYADLHPMIYRTLELQCATFCQLQGMPPESYAGFHEEILSECHSTSDSILVALLENLKAEFPAAFENQPPIGELIKKISPNSPGKPFSPYDGGSN